MDKNQLAAQSPSAELISRRADRFNGVDGDWSPVKQSALFASRSQVLELAVQLSRSVPGHIMEFGVWKGHSTRAIRDAWWRGAFWSPRQWSKRIYACDSFAGLPENYEHLAAGTFATPIPRLTGIRIVQGFFEESLTAELAAEVGRVSLVHVDVDLYSAAKTVLNWVAPLLSDGALLVFDEFGGEDPAEERALDEWLEATGREVLLIGLFGREPSGGGDRTDRRAIFQVVGGGPVPRLPAPLPARIRRRLMSRW